MRQTNKLSAAAPGAFEASFSHNGRLVAVGYLDGAVRIWDFQTEQRVAEFTDQHSRIWSVVFSPDDRWLVAGGWDRRVVFYDVHARRSYRPMTQSSWWIMGLAFSPDGKTVASAEGDGVIRLWNVATRAVDQLGPIDINAGQIPGLGTAGQPLKQAFGRTAVTTQYQPLGTNQYNALQSKLERHFAQGVQVAASYTWSKAIGVTANDDATPRVNALPFYYLNRTVLNFDRTQNLTISAVAELPFGKGKRWVSGNRWGAAILGGWRVNTLLTFMSGLPFSVTASGSSLNMPGNNTQRADQVKGTVDILGGIGSASSYFDPLAFKPITTARFGNAGFNSMRGPGVANMDFGIFREFAVKERLKIQFRAEAFNFTNTPHFALPGTNASNLVLNPDGTVRNLAGYTAITSTQNLGRDFDERHIRFGLRLSF